MKSIPYLFIISLLWSYHQKEAFVCAKSKKSVQTDFALLEANFENHQSGIRGGPSSTEYFFKLLILTSDKLNFDSVWMNNTRYGVYITKDKTSANNNATLFFIHDTITLRISDIHEKLIRTVTPPVINNGRALLRYTCNGDINYYTIKKIDQKIIPNHP